MRYLYSFRHKARVVTMGPHESLKAAQDAFQFRFGYWPGDPLDVEVWVPRGTSE